MEVCRARAPYTLLGFLLDGRERSSVSSSACLSPREYFARATNFLLWIALVSITFLLCRKLVRLFTLWASGGKIPGPPCPSFFAGHAKLVAGCGSARDLTDRDQEVLGGSRVPRLERTNRYNCATQMGQSNYEEVKSIGRQAGNDTTIFSGNILSGNGSLVEKKMEYLVSKEEPFRDILGVMFHGCLTITNLVCIILTWFVLYPELQNEGATL